MKTIARMLLSAVAAVVLCGSLYAQDAAARRTALLRDDVTIEALASALEDEDVLVARTAARVLPSRGRDALPALGKALRHEDLLVRRCAAMNLGKLGSAGIELIKRALHDENELVRQGAVFALSELPQNAETADLLTQASRDESVLVQRAALLVARAAYKTAETIALPAEGWRFRTDTEDVGVDEKWFEVDYDDSEWEPIAIEQFWGEQGPESGVGWYRLTFDLPAREAPFRVQLDFQAVDESAWIWVNGQFAGVHDLGPSGWDKPFRIDVTGMLNWGGSNQITVRVLNTAMAGGIYKPVRLILLEPAQ